MASLKGEPFAATASPIHSPALRLEVELLDGHVQGGDCLDETAGDIGG